MNTFEARRAAETAARNIYWLLAYCHVDDLPMADRRLLDAARVLLRRKVVGDPAQPYFRDVLAVDVQNDLRIVETVTYELADGETAWDPMTDRRPITGPAHVTYSQKPGTGIQTVIREEKQ